MAEQVASLKKKPELPVPKALAGELSLTTPQAPRTQPTGLDSVYNNGLTGSTTPRMSAPTAADTGPHNPYPALIPAPAPYQGTFSQARREVFYRQASLAAQMQRLGLPPMAEWVQGVTVGRAVVSGEAQDRTQQAAANRQLNSRNPILQHQRKTSARMAKQRPAAVKGPVTRVTDLVDDGWVEEEPLVKVMARLTTTDGVRHKVIEAMLNQRPYNPKRREGGVPGNEVEAGDLSSANTRAVVEARMRLAAAPPQRHRQGPGTTTGSGPQRERLLWLAEQLAAAKQAGTELGIDLPGPPQARPAADTQATAANTLSPQPAAAADSRSIAPVPAANDAAAAADMLPSFHPGLSRKHHSAPDDIEVVVGVDGLTPAVVMYPLREHRLGARPMDLRGLPLHPQQLHQELQEDNAKLMCLDAYQQPNVAPGNELVWQPHIRPPPHEEQSWHSEEEPQAPERHLAAVQGQGSQGGGTPGSAPDPGHGTHPEAQLERPSKAEPLPQLIAAGAQEGGKQPLAGPGKRNTKGKAAARRAAADPPATAGHQGPDLNRFHDASDSDSCAGKWGGESLGPQGSSSSEDSWGINPADTDAYGFPRTTPPPDDGPTRASGGAPGLGPSAQPPSPVRVPVVSGPGPPPGPELRSRTHPDDTSQHEDHAEQQQQGDGSPGSRPACYMWPRRVRAVQRSSDDDSEVDSTGSWGIEPQGGDAGQQPCLEGHEDRFKPGVGRTHDACRTKREAQPDLIKPMYSALMFTPPPDWLTQPTSSTPARYESNGGP